MQQTSLRKTIWFLWFQGEEQMPEIVRMCYRSWQIHNPNWTLQLLTTENLREFTNVAEILGSKWHDIPPAAQSDLIRITLLQKHGGVWADASTFCTQPLDSWLPDRMSAGFYMFTHPNSDRLISSWFMAATANHELVNVYAHAAIDFWKNMSPRILLERQKSYSGLQALAKWLYTKNPTWAVNSGFLSVTKISHYFWFHYIFSWLVQNDNIASTVWAEMSKVPAHDPHKLLHFGYTKPIDSKMKAELDNPTVQLYKLNWRFNLAEIPNSAMAYLRDSMQ